MNRPTEPPSDDADSAAQLVLTREASRLVDRLAVERYGVPSIVLMENAAVALRQAARRMLGDETRRGVLIACGPGNNGGDGLALARHLHNAGLAVAIVTTRPLAAYSGDAGVQAAIVARMGLTVEECRGEDAAGPFARATTRLGSPPALVVDALLGTGQIEPARGVLLAAIREVNRLGAAGAAVLAVDVPTGLDADTGATLGEAVHAKVTVTMVAPKPGLLLLRAQAYAGEIVVGDIGAPVELLLELGVPASAFAAGRGAHASEDAPLPNAPGRPGSPGAARR
ncbi:MAG: NAD(P)H-hydrate epimerase [Phycisphaeraceae bacterium]|nr:NAD(P)H-hydrate epimerase [Phycisphaeraceae bacterium]